MNVSSIGNIIRWPIEMIGEIINFIFSYFIPIAIIVIALYVAIIVIALYVVYFIHSRRIPQKIANWISGLDKKNIEELNGKM